MDYDERIRNYLRQQMSSKDQKEFEADLMANPGLAEDVIIQQIAMKMTDDIQDESLLEQMKKFHEEEKGQVIKKKRFLYLGVAASVLLLIAIFSGYQIRQYSNSKLYAFGEDKYLSFEDQLRSDDGQNEKFDAEKIYILQQKENSQTQEAINYFSSFSNDHVLFPYAQFNLGYGFILIQDYPQAIQIFESLSAQVQVEEELTYKIRFYLALTYLLNNQTHYAKRLLNEIHKSDNNPYATRAKELLNKLRSPWRRYFYQ